MSDCFAAVTFFIALTAGSAVALLLVWIGYPVGMWLLARVAGSPIAPDYNAGQTRMVSVILATRESSEAVAARVANLLDTEHPAHLLQVIVALDAAGSKSSVAELTGIDGRVVAVGGSDVPIAVGMLLVGSTMVSVSPL